MSLREDILRASQYGKEAEFKAIQATPSYQTQLSRTKKDFQGRSWIDFSGFLPRFTTDEYEKKRTQYQAKYGTSVNIPGFEDIIHIIPKSKITVEEMAAHTWASRRKLPSPLTAPKLLLLAAKKYRFLKSLASPTPTWLRTYGAVASAMDNVEDALVTLYWSGRLIVGIAPRLLGKTTSVLGWLLMGSDVLNLANVISWAGAMTRGCKGLHGHLQSKNPFHKKYKAEHAIRLKQRMPGFGAFTEFLQTADQLFGFGLCLGGLFGMVQDQALKTMDPEYWKHLGKLIQGGNINEISVWVARATFLDVERIKNALQQEFKVMNDEMFRLREVDIKLREEVGKWIDQKAKEAWNWIKTTPESVSKYYSDPLIASMILSTGMQEFTQDQHTKAFLFLNQAMNGVMPWWYENDPIQNMPNLTTYEWRAPEPKEPDTIALLEESIHDWKSTIKWPHIEKEYATFEEIAYDYSSRIKESFQTYCLTYQHEYGAMAAAFECTDFVGNVMRCIDDNHEVRTGMTAYLAAGIDMMDTVHIMPPDITSAAFDQLANFIGDYERAHVEPVPIHDIIAFGESIGIEWMTQFPKKTFDKVAELFPGWQAIQDQLADLFVAN
jgi:hypothetical protein